MTSLVKNILVVGAGQMGTGIAQVFASSNFQVTLVDLNEEILNNAKTTIIKSISRLVDKELVTPSAKSEILENLTFSTSLDIAKGFDLVVEAIIENLTAKKSLFQQLETICSLDTIFASNTSSFSITELSPSSQRSSKMIGMHFFNPPTRMKLIEVIKGAKTSEETFSKVMELAKTINKTPIPVIESAGFIVNRLLASFLNEAYFMLQEGISSIEDIDNAVKLGLRHPMGPFELS
ncbi:MAG: 3-hydroxyacyl-CoA dehydrogenase family protein, partial [Candidatus Heimdallarchaeota archaeon]|nr:3-hydroxyacyl-CoA dehydrogenase family protein [Candidatus Heimdallarchaeota archaeon]MCK5047805.1 3-hydroxyacyl-CoA dehydrogenase family protein [Candidatus Heimdallarchaeota archaeon]